MLVVQCCASFVGLKQDAADVRDGKEIKSQVVPHVCAGIDLYVGALLSGPDVQHSV
jgi:hypothetical protein